MFQYSLGIVNEILFVFSSSSMLDDNDWRSIIVMDIGRWDMIWEREGNKIGGE